MQTRVCRNTTCPYHGEPQPLENFYRAQAGPEGRDTLCKTCSDTRGYRSLFRGSKRNHVLGVPKDAPLLRKPAYLCKFTCKLCGCGVYLDGKEFTSQADAAACCMLLTKGGGSMVYRKEANDIKTKLTQFTMSCTDDTPNKTELVHLSEELVSLLIEFKDIKGMSKKDVLNTFAIAFSGALDAVLGQMLEFSDEVAPVNG